MRGTQFRRAGARALALLALLGAASGPRAWGDEIILADLLAEPGASFRSADGRVEFSDFSYTPLAGAAVLPQPQSVRLTTDPQRTSGFWTEGAFQVLNGVSMSALIEFTATSLTGGGFDSAALRLGASSAFDFSMPGLGDDVSVVDFSQWIEPAGGGPRVEMHASVDSRGGGIRSVTSNLDPETFGDSIRVSQTMTLQSRAGEAGSVAILGSYWTTFTVVPEPTTLLLLVAVGPIALLRRYRR